MSVDPEAEVRADPGGDSQGVVAGGGGGRWWRGVTSMEITRPTFHWEMSELKLVALQKVHCGTGARRRAAAKLTMHLNRVRGFTVPRPRSGYRDATDARWAVNWQYQLPTFSVEDSQGGSDQGFHHHAYR